MELNKFGYIRVYARVIKKQGKRKSFEFGELQALK
jgi:hypothetical protein